MKALIHKIVSLAMAFLLLASTTSFAVGKHYCMGRLMSVSFFAHAEDCGMDMDIPGYGALAMEDSDSCCSDRTVFIQGQDDLKASTFVGIDFGSQFLPAEAHFQLFLAPDFEERSVPSDGYPPPILVKDIYLFHQVFLI